MLYSIGKDSGYGPAGRRRPSTRRRSLPLMHVDTTWKFREMIEFRDRFCRENGSIDRLHQPGGAGARDQPDRARQPGPHQRDEDRRAQAGAGPVRLRRRLRRRAAGRGEERAKERVFSFRDRDHQWDPRTSGGALNLFTRSCARRVDPRFPASNGPSWTSGSTSWSRDAVVPLYFAKERPIVERDGALIMVDDDRFRWRPARRRLR